ncbi:MAG: hypothetical protein D6803_00825 [Anaerolineae bacterium]|nr:MAG: hypothetical protein D6803_00825 [Anaerolineae bacterium]
MIHQTKFWVRTMLLVCVCVVIAGLSACNLPASAAAGPQQATPAQAPLQEQSAPPASGSPAEAEPPPQAVSADLIQPEDLEYLGAFRLPEGSGGSNWEYSGHGLTYYPQGDPNGADDGFPGSLFGFGHDQHLLVSEISIPAPVLSKNLDDLNTAETLQPFQDISGGLFDPQSVDIPRGGLAYLPPAGEQDSPRLHFAFGWHFQEFGDASHGWSALDLANPQAAGLWVFDGYTPYVTNDYLFEIPDPWAAALDGYRLASGRAREGPWSGRGPALFAYAPWQDGNPPAGGASLAAVKPLLLYGVQEPGNVEIVSDESQAVNGYGDSDHWWGGAWLTAGEKAAVVFVGTKAMGESWYGFANGVVWPYDCAEQDPPTCPEVPEWPYDNRGYWAEGYQAQIIFYNPADLVAVARGEMESWKPQPYATLVLDDYLFDPNIHLEDYKRDLVGAAAFDRERGYLYVVERLADEYKSVIHVFRVRP